MWNRTALWRKSDETGQTHSDSPVTMNTMAVLDRLLQRVQIYCQRNQAPEFYQFASWALHYEHTTFGFDIVPLALIAPQSMSIPKVAHLWVRLRMNLLGGLVSEELYFTRRAAKTNKETAELSRRL